VTLEKRKHTLPADQHSQPQKQYRKVKGKEAEVQAPNGFKHRA